MKKHVWCIIHKNERFPSKSMNFIFFTLARILAWGKEWFMIEKAKIIYSFAKKKYYVEKYITLIMRAHSGLKMEK